MADDGTALALAMALHARLGSDSPLHVLPSDTLEKIAAYLHKLNRDTFSWRDLEVFELGLDTRLCQRMASHSSIRRGSRDMEVFDMDDFGSPPVSHAELSTTTD
eukprot:scaffold219591_cov43-Tisochrysis_lutea.AAC.2